MQDERAALLDEARALGGRTLRELADALDSPLPRDLKRHKGYVGRLVERALGVSSPNAAGPDVPELGVEIKTLPVDARQRPVESTFVCSIRLHDACEARWETSSVRRKLGCVLFVPVEADRDLPLAVRRVGSAFLWEPSEDEWQGLEADWTELLGQLGRAGPEGLTAHRGDWLQVRPKAKNAAQRTRGRELDAAPARMPPKGFYLRASFTRGLLQRAFRGGR